MRLKAVGWACSPPLTLILSLAAAAPGENMIPNGSFDAGLKGWAGSPGWQVVDEHGERFLRLRFPAGRAGRRSADLRVVSCELSSEDRIAVKPDTMYRLSFRYLADVRCPDPDERDPWRVMSVWIHGITPNQDKPSYLLGLRCNPSREWTRSVAFFHSGSASRVRLGLSLEGKGEARADDFDLREAEDEDYRGPLLRQGGFEEGTSVPAGWWLQNRTDAHVSLDRDIPFLTGSQSLRIDLEQNGKASLATRSGLPVVPGSLYTVVCWVKGSRSNMKFSIKVDGQGWQKGAPGHWYKTHAVLVTKHWTRLQREVTVPGPGHPKYWKKRYTVTVGLRASPEFPCTIWADGVQLQQTNTRRKGNRRDPQ